MKKVVCVFLTVGCLCMGSLSVTAETYTIGLLGSVAWVQYRVAEVNGFWEKEGVDVQLIEYAHPVDSMRAGFQRRFDLCLMPMPFMLAFLSGGVPDAVYLGSFSVPKFGKSVIVKKDLVNKSLKGQTIGVFLDDPSTRFLLLQYLKTVNTNLTDVRPVSMNDNDLKANFINNRLQVILTVVGMGDRFYEQADGVRVLSIEDMYEPHGIALIKEGGATSIPHEDLKKIMRGCVEAIEWMRDPVNWDEYKAILKQYVFADRPNLTDEQLRELIKQEEFFDPQTLLQHNQQILYDYFAEYRNFLVAEGSLDANVLNSFTYDNVIYNQALIEVLQEDMP